MALLVPYMAYSNFLLIYEIRVQTPYDLPSMAFYALALYSILNRRRAVFYAVFTVASFNRETTLFLPFLFLLGQLREDRGLVDASRSVGLRPISELAVQLVIWEGIHAWTGSLVSPGTLVWAGHPAQNFHFIVDPLHWPTFASVFGFLWVPYLVCFRAIPNVYLKRCSVLLIPWFLFMFFFGDLLEIRLESEWISYLAVCMALLASANASELRNA
jgi:hypothetical protein